MIEKFFLGSDNRLCIEKKIDKFNGIKDFLFELWLFLGLVHTACGHTSPFCQTRKIGVQASRFVPTRSGKRNVGIEKVESIEAEVNLK